MVVLLSNAFWSIRGSLISLDLLGSLGIVSGAWCIVLGGHVLADAFESTVWIALAFAAATALALIARPRRSSARWVSTFALGFGSGFASYPAWVAGIWITGSGLGSALSSGLGSGLGLDSKPPGSAAPPVEVTLWVSTVAMAPVFEELLYRERLVPLLRERFGRILAVVISSGLFAISHVHPWSVVGCFLIGLALGSVYLASHSTPLCISIHAGFNVASLSCGLPPERLSLSPGSSALVAGAATLVAVVLLHRRKEHGEPVARNGARGR